MWIRRRCKSSPRNCSGSWTTPGPYARLTSPYKKVEAINRKIETPDKENAQFEAGMRLKLSESDADYPAMVLANYMFGGSITARMPNRIRNREGLSYGASSRFTAPAEGDAALFSATVSCNPVNMPKVEASFVDELKKTLREGFTQAELTEAKRAYADARKVSRSQEAALVGLIASHEQLGRTLLYDEQQEARIQALTLEQINAAFRKYLDPRGGHRQGGRLQEGRGISVAEWLGRDLVRYVKDESQGEVPDKSLTVYWRCPGCTSCGTDSRAGRGAARRRDPVPGAR